MHCHGLWAERGKRATSKKKMCKTYLSLTLTNFKEYFLRGPFNLTRIIKNLESSTKFSNFVTFVYDFYLL